MFTFSVGCVHIQVHIYFVTDFCLKDFHFVIFPVSDISTPTSPVKLSAQPDDSRSTSTHPHDHATEPEQPGQQEHPELPELPEQPDLMSEELNDIRVVAKRLLASQDQLVPRNDVAEHADLRSTKDDETTARGKDVKIDDSTRELTCTASPSSSSSSSTSLTRYV